MDDNVDDLHSWRKYGLSYDAARILREAMRKRRASLKSGAHGLGSGSSADKLNRSRYANAKARQFKKSLVGPSPIRWEKADMRLLKPLPEPILNNLCSNRKKDWIPPLARRHKEATIDLTNFSFVDDPIGTMEKLREVAEAELSVTSGRLNFLDITCEDIGPYLVLHEMNRGMVRVFKGGKISRQVQRVLHFVGLRETMRMTFPTDSGTATGLWPLPVKTRHAQSRTARRLLAEQTSEIVASEICDRINGWLKVLANLELSLDGERLLLKVAGEALDNAERHSHPDSEGSWSIAGFMSRQVRNESDPSDAIYRCYLSFISTGDTIAESISRGGTFTMSRINDYIRRHRRGFNKKFTSENLATVYALQDGVSRVGEGLLQSRGGTGLQDIIEFFASLSGSAAPDADPKLAIVSGRTCVLVKAPYIQGERKVGGGVASSGRDLLSPRELWFNTSNSPEHAPDPNHVIQLPAKLQGTLVTMAWTMDGEFLEMMANGTR